MTFGIYRIIMIYAVFASLWILLSDKIVAWLLSDPAQIILVSTLKGCLFVGFTSLLLYRLLGRQQTEIKRQLEVLFRQKRDRSQRHLDMVQTFMLELDDQGKITMINRKGCELLGYREDELVGQFWFTTCLPQPQGMEEIYPVFQQIMNGDMHGVEYFENPVVCRDGRQRLIAWHNTCYSDDNSRIISFLSSGEDITERQQTEEKINKLSLAVEQSPESIVITDLAANIEYVNETFIRNTGYTAEEVIGRNPRILNSGKTPPATYMAMWDSLKQGHTWKGEFYNKRKDGSEYIEFAIITPIHQPDGHITHYVAIKEDITERKQMGEELAHHRYHLEELVEKRTTELAEARERAESANLAKSAFLANMSHEIRTPINAIVGLTHLLQRDSHDSEQQKKLAKITVAARQLLAFINDILDLSEIEAGRLQLNTTDFSLKAVFDHTHSLIAEQAGSKGISIEVDTDNVPHWLRGDVTLISQALLNYAENAVKFTEHGSIALRARLLEEKDNEVQVRFEVQDSGIGIAAEQLPHLFQAFAQADISTTRKHSGTGLGLAITSRLAQVLGGEAGVESKPGQGSTFWFTAKLRRGQEIPLPAEQDRHELLGHIANLDPTLCLSNLRGNTALYVKLLQQFTLSHSNDAAQITELLSSGDFQASRDVAHGLKGVAATIGASRVRDLAAQLETASREEQPASKTAHLLKALAQEQALLHMAILALPEDAGQERTSVASTKDGTGATKTHSPEIAQADPVRLREVLSELEGLLTENNGRASLLIRDAASLLRPAMGASFNELSQQIEAFNFEAALKILHTVSNQGPVPN